MNYCKKGNGDMADRNGKGAISEHLREAIVSLGTEFHEHRIVLFGSRARGDNRPDSDYDFLITKGNVTTLWRMASLYYSSEKTASQRKKSESGQDK